MVDVIISEKTIFTSWTSELKILRHYPGNVVGMPSMSFGKEGSHAYSMKRDGQLVGNVRAYEEYVLVENGKKAPNLFTTRACETIHRLGLEFELEEDAVAFKLACP